MTPGELELLLLKTEDISCDNTSGSSGAEDGRLSFLLEILQDCQTAQESKSDILEDYARVLADGSRNIVWRLPFGKSGILDFFLALLAEDDLSHNLKFNALRLVGNCCADLNENRARTVSNERLNAVIRHVQDEGLHQVIIPVLYNILVDYDPAQRLASQSLLSRRLIALFPSLLSNEHDAPWKAYCSKTLALLATQDGEPNHADPSTIRVLLSAAAKLADADELEDFITLVGVALIYLNDARFQSHLIDDNEVPLFLQVFEFMHGKAFDLKSEDPEVASEFKQMRRYLLDLLSDLSAHDSFASHYPLSSSAAKTLTTWLRGGNRHLQAAACIALGNLSRSDEAASYLVERGNVLEPLTRISCDLTASNSQLLHSALSFLKNLAIPRGNKAKLGELLDARYVPRLFSLYTSSQVQFAAISLTRLLLVHCPQNVRRILPSENIDELEVTVGDPVVIQIQSLFARSDTEPTKVEAARCLATVCRVLYSAGSSESILENSGSAVRKPLENVDSTHSKLEIISQKPRIDDDACRSRLIRKLDFSRPLVHLLKQQEWPNLRSEATFILALMSRSRDSAAIVLSTLDDSAVMDVLTDVAAGPQKTSNGEKSSRQVEPTFFNEHPADPTSLSGDHQLEHQEEVAGQPLRTRQLDLENTLLIFIELLKKENIEMDASREEIFRGLLRKGSSHLDALKGGTSPMLEPHSRRHDTSTNA